MTTVTTRSYIVSHDIYSGKSGVKDYLRALEDVGVIGRPVVRTLGQFGSSIHLQLQILDEGKVGVIDNRLLQRYGAKRE